jgi:serine/threonine protein kinase, bacterial
VFGRGDVIGGFEIQGVLRSGPRGVVYEAKQGGEERVVALRVLDLRLSHDPAFVERFRQQEWPEHPHIVSVFEAGEWEHGLFVAMQLIRGDTIAEKLAGGGLDGSAALAALTEVASALDSAHDAGLAHGWVRPEAVLIDEDGLGRRAVPRGSWETASALMTAVSDRLARGEDAGGWRRRPRRGAPPPG